MTVSFSFQQLTSWLKSIFPSHEGRVLNKVKEWLENEIEDSQEFVDAKENGEDWVTSDGTDDIYIGRNEAATSLLDQIRKWEGQ